MPKARKRLRKVKAATKKKTASRPKKKNGLFTRAEKRKIKRKLKKKLSHPVKGAARRGLLGLFGIGRKKAKSPAASSRTHRSTSPASDTGLRDDVISALVNQGYSRKQASTMVPTRRSSGDTFESLFRGAIRKNPARPAKRKKRRNPDMDQESHAAMHAFRKFHGADPDKVTEVIDRMVEQKKFWLLGRLQGYDLHQFPLYRDAANKNTRPNVDTWNANISLCCDPPQSRKDKCGRQLFLHGGDQNLEWALANHFDIRSNVQLVVLGTIDRIWYVTKKSFDNFETSSYIHRFGEEGGEKPLLVYDRLKKKQWIVGGDYEVKPEGIAN